MLLYKTNVFQNLFLYSFVFVRALWTVEELKTVQTDVFFEKIYLDGLSELSGYYSIDNATCL